MFDESAEQPASDQTAPMGMRELPPQPARPVMPAYTLPSAGPAAAPRIDEPSVPGTDDSVVASDDHVEGTFTSRGTVVVIGSLKGRVEAMRLRIEPGASVDADVIVDEAIVAGEFTGNLTCRERLEARPTGRISGRVETYKLMLHEGASVEGEMHMLTERPRDASETIRGTAPLRGETSDAKSVKATSASAGAAPTAQSAPVLVGTPTPSSSAVPATRPAPVVAPASVVKPSRASTGQPATQPSGSTVATSSVAPTQLPSVEAILAQRSPAAQSLRIDSLRVAPRATTSSARPSSSAGSAGNGSRGRNGTTTAF